ncbi:MAG TPA: lipoate--protein ligase family protein [Candidatus Limnocylindrales bacterium]|jgi:lipoate-protein ligase A|nr:lipoate--protein ligase family protein [Candidatus Limnocylindrales bacterium]
MNLSDQRQYIDTSKNPAAFNMALDEALMEAAPQISQPILRFYGWTEPAASFGYFQNYAEVKRLTALRPLVRRPTGGGIVPHDADWTYSLVWPAHHSWHSLSAIESYRRVHEWIQAAFARLGVVTELAPHPVKTSPGQCFAGFERFDLLWRGRKIAGAAQRRTRHVLLIQGSVQSPSISISRADWQQAMLRSAELGERVRWTEFRIDQVLSGRVRELEQRKYSQSAYNEKR